MPRPTVSLQRGSNSETLVQAVQEIQRILSGGQTFGDPGRGVGLAAVAGGRLAQTIGTSDNLATSTVECTLTNVSELNTNLVVRHALRLPVPPAVPGPNQRLNVRWWVAGLRQKGTSPSLGTDLWCHVAYVDGNVGADELQLRFYTNAPLAGSGAPNTGDLVVTLMFIPSST